MANTKTILPPHYYQLQTPVNIMGRDMQYLVWNLPGYPAQKIAAWGLVENLESNKSIISGQTELTDDILSKWTTDDAVIPQWLEENQVWLAIFNPTT